MFWMCPPESVKTVSIPSPLSIRATRSPPSICAIHPLLRTAVYGLARPEGREPLPDASHRRCHLGHREASQLRHGGVWREPLPPRIIEALVHTAETSMQHTNG